MTHPEEKHGEWKERKDRERQEQKGRKVGTENANPNVPNESNQSGTRKSKFVLSDQLKQALLTDHGFSEFQLEQLQSASQEK